MIFFLMKIDLIKLRDLKTFFNADAAARVIAVE